MSVLHEKLDNPLGFTRETAALLSGLGCTNLTKFRKKEVSIDDLKYLTLEDLKILEVGDEFDYESFRKLSASLRKKCDIDNTPRSRDILKILQNEYKQIRVLEIYLQMLYEQISQNKEDYLLDINKNLKASQALMQACDSVIEEINQLEVIIEDAMGKKSNYNIKLNNKVKYSILAGGIGVIALVYIFR